MNISEFIKSKNERFSLLYGLYLILYFILVLGIDVDFILYYIITALVAVMLALITIIFQLEVIVDNFFFKFRKSVDMNIYKILKKIWKKSFNTANCKEECKYLKNTNCDYNFDINDKKVQLICMNRCFYPIINSDVEFNPSKSFIYQGFLNYYICIIILMISALSPFFVNITLVFKINEGLITEDIEQLLIRSITLQLYCILLLIFFQILSNYSGQKSNKLSVIFRILTILFSIIYYIISIYFINLILIGTASICQNSIILYLLISTFSLIASLLGRKSKRVKDYILKNQKLQLDIIIDIEINNGSVSEKLHKAICQEPLRAEFYNSKCSNHK